MKYIYLWFYHKLIIVNPFGASLPTLFCKIAGILFSYLTFSAIYKDVNLFLKRAPLGKVDSFRVTGNWAM